MKFEIYNAKKENNEPIRLAFEEYGDSICVVAVDKFGERLKKGYLLKFCLDGTIRVLTAVDPDLGFQLNGNGQIIIQ